MNIATLRKIKLLSDNYSKFIEDSKTSLARMRFPGHFTSSFYLSESTPDELYLVSFWQSQEAAQAALTRLKKEGTDQMRAVVSAFDPQFFRLAWEYRLLSTVPKASLLRMITYPAHFSEDDIARVINLQRQRRDQTPGLVGVWLGQSLDNPRLILNQIDWTSLEAQQNFFDQPAVREGMARWQSQGITIEYASLNLKGFLQLEEMVD